MKKDLLWAARVFWLASAAVLACGAALAAKSPPTRSTTGIVSQVIDGNSLRLSPREQPTIVVRLAGVEAPAIC